MGHRLFPLLAVFFALLWRAEGAHASEPADAHSDREVLVMLRMAPPHFRPNGSYGGSYGDAQSRTARKRVAQRIARENRLEVIDSWPMPSLGVDCFVMRVPPDLSPDEVIARISRHRMVEWSQRMNQYHANGGYAAASDPLLGASPAATTWRLSELHRIATGRGVSIAVIDSKVDVAHPDLAGQFVAVEDFVRRPSRPERHGTQVAGVIAAKANNGLGSAGVAPGARLMALRACWQADARPTSPTLCNSLSLARAIEFAINHEAKVINLSVSGPPDILLKKLLERAMDRSAVVVAAY